MENFLANPDRIGIISKEAGMKMEREKEQAPEIAAPQDTGPPEGQRRAALERLVAEISAGFVGLTTGSLDAEVDQALLKIGGFVGADRSYVFLYDSDAVTMSNTHEWCAEGIEPQIEMLQNLPITSFPWVKKQFDENAVIDVPCLDELPEEAVAFKEILEAQDIQSVILVRMLDRQGELYGFIGFDEVRGMRPWKDEDIYLLQVVGGIISVAVQRYQADEKLRQNERRLQALHDAVPDIMMVVAADETIRSFHAPSGFDLPLKPDRLIGATVDRILPPEEMENARRAFRHTLDSGEPTNFEFELKLPRGNRFFEARLARQDESSILAVARDVTERKEVENSLRAHRRRLRRLASELTLAEEEQRRELAVKLHDGIGQELAVARIRLQKLQNENPGQESEHLQRVVGLLEQALQRTQDLTFDLSPPALHEIGLLAAVRSLGNRLAAEEGIQFQCLETGQKLEPPADIKVLLFRIVRELFTNAIKHGRPSAISLELSTWPERVQLVVSDDGCGFGSDRSEAAFQSGKSGFGLFSIRERIESLNGTLEIQSPPGSRVTVSVPIPAEAAS